MNGQFDRGSAAWRHHMREYQRARLKQVGWSALIILVGLGLLWAILLGSGPR